MPLTSVVSGGSRDEALGSEGMCVCATRSVDRIQLKPAPRQVVLTGKPDERIMQPPPKVNFFFINWSGGRGHAKQVCPKL